MMLDDNPIMGIVIMIFFVISVMGMAWSLFALFQRMINGKTVFVRDDEGGAWFTGYSRTTNEGTKKD